jgi:hypothetical protein
LKFAAIETTNAERSLLFYTLEGGEERKKEKKMRKSSQEKQERGQGGGAAIQFVGRGTGGTR